MTSHLTPDELRQGYLVPWRPYARRERAHSVAALPPVDGLATHAMGLSDFGKIAAALLDKQGWTTGSFQNAKGELCLHGALMAVGQRGAEQHRTDSYIASQVFNARGKTTAWNDKTAAGAAEVKAALEEKPLADDEITALFGPSWPQIVHLVRFLSDHPDALYRSRVYRGQDYPPAALAGAVLTAAAGSSGLGSLLDQVDNVMRYAHEVVPILSELVSEALTRRHGNLTMACGVLPALIGLTLREHLLTSRYGAYLYGLLTTEFRRAVGPLHADDHDPAPYQSDTFVTVPYTEHLIATEPQLADLIRHHHDRVRPSRLPSNHGGAADFIDATVLGASYVGYTSNGSAATFTMTMTEEQKANLKKLMVSSYWAPNVMIDPAAVKITDVT